MPGTHSKAFYDGPLWPRSKTKFGPESSRSKTTVTRMNAGFDCFEVCTDLVVITKGADAPSRASSLRCGRRASQRSAYVFRPGTHLPPTAFVSARTRGAGPIVFWLSVKRKRKQDGQPLGLEREWRGDDGPGPTLFLLSVKRKRKQRGWPSAPRNGGPSSAAKRSGTTLEKVKRATAGERTRPRVERQRNESPGSAGIFWGGPALRDGPGKGEHCSTAQPGALLRAEFIATI